jgi:hypothetical protein
MATSLMEKTDPSLTDAADEQAHLACGECEYPVALCGEQAVGDWVPYDESSVCSDCLEISGQTICPFCGALL